MPKYINKLRDEEIESFLNINGYNLVTNITDKEGYPVVAIERFDNKILIRAEQIIKDNFKTELENYLIKKTPYSIITHMINSKYNPFFNNIDLILIEDYYLCILGITKDDQKKSEILCDSYIDYMIEKFPTYKKDLITFINTLPDDELDNNSII